MGAAKECLLRIGKIDRMIDLKIAEKEHLESMLYRITPMYQQDKVQNGGGNGKREEALVRLADLEDEVKESIDMYLSERGKIMQLLCSVRNEKYYNMLVRKYVLRQTWDHIAEDMGYQSVRGAQYAHKRALAVFEKIMKERGVDA